MGNTITLLLSIFLSFFTQGNHGVNHANAVVSIEPSITPTDTPAVTPTITPSVTPSITPSVTPSVSPAVTPSPSPSVTPSPSPVQEEDKDDESNDDVDESFHTSVPFGTVVSGQAHEKNQEKKEDKHSGDK